MPQATETLGFDATRAYLQVLDVGDLDHLALLAERVGAEARGL